MEDTYEDTLPSPYSALVLGATGSVGGPLVAKLLASDRCTRVTAVARRALPSEDKLSCVVWPDYTETLIRDPQRATAVVGGHDVVFCCLGASRADAIGLLYNPKKYGAAFRRVDHDYVVAAASVAKRAGVEHFSVVSSMGADPQARFVYSKIKGEMEEALEGLAFSSLSIFRPSQLTRAREERGHVLERAGLAMMPMIDLLLPARFKSIGVDVLAEAMKEDFEGGGGGREDSVKIYPSDQIHRLADARAHLPGPG